MKILRYIFAALLFVFAVFNSAAQSGSPLVTNLIPTNGRVTTNSTFRVDVSFNYNSDVTDQFMLIMELPSTVEWTLINDDAFARDKSSIDIDIDGITNSGSTYYIPFQTLIAGEKSLSFVIRNLVNRNEGNCTEDIATPINFTYQGLVNGSYTDIHSTTNNLITPVLTNTPSQIYLHLSQNQEKNEDNTNSGNFPYYVDVKVWSSGAISTLPAISLTYPNNQLQFIKAVLFNNNDPVPPFHHRVLDETHISENENGVFSILADPGVTFNSGENYIRFYFQPTFAETIPSNAITLSANGAKYRSCSEELNINVSPISIGDFTIATTDSPFYPSFSHANRPLRFCSQNCNFNVSQFSSSFYFEINSIYVPFGSTVPRVKVDCPSDYIQVHSLKFNTTQVAGQIPIIKFKTVGSTVLQNATVSEGQVLFGNSYPDVIYIENYTSENSDAKTLDFEVNYSSRTTDLSVINSSLRRFSLQYENSPNSKVYYSTPITIENTCAGGLKFTDSYEDIVAGGYRNYVSYYGDDVLNVLLKIEPIDENYRSNYSIQDFTYKLHPNMQFDPLSTQILISETGPNQNLKVLRRIGSVYTLSNGNSAFQEIEIQVNRSENELIIHNIDVNNSNYCGVQKQLYIIFRTKVFGSASYSTSWYQSSVTDPLASFSSIPTLSYWNINADTDNKVSTEVSTICPGDGQEFSNFEEGQIVTVQYLIFNENQNPIKNMNIQIPVLNSATLVNGNGDLIIRTRNNTTNLASGFQPTISSNTLSLVSPSNYILNGNDRLLINVQYKLNDGLSNNTVVNNITFNLESYENAAFSGLVRARVEPYQVKSISIVENSTCIPRPPCNNCVTSFSPIPGQEYLLSAWIKESYNTVNSPNPYTYENSGVQISFNDGDIVNTDLYTPQGPIIDGWQRVERSFTVPVDAYNIQIDLVNNGENNAFFDDIRIHPFRSNMKSFVYDPSTQRLVAELDENNYSTLYEYDDEGILIRVKKETERGIMTIKETRNNQSKR